MWRTRPTPIPSARRNSSRCGKIPILIHHSARSITCASWRFRLRDGQPTMRSSMASRCLLKSGWKVRSEPTPRPSGIPPLSEEVMKLLRDPLLHFVLLGAVIFAVYYSISKTSYHKPDEIVITRGTVENMIIGFTRTWQRPPTGEELKGLIREYIREEAAYREAIAVGLDRDDTIVRKRLRQKLEF